LQSEELFSWYEKHLNYGDQIGIFLVSENYSTGFLSVNREVGASAIEPEVYGLLDRLKLHLKRAMSIHHQLIAMHADQFALSQVLEKPQQG